MGFHTSKIFTSYIPSGELKAQAQRILTKYPDKDPNTLYEDPKHPDKEPRFPTKEEVANGFTKRLETLIKGMHRDGIWQEDIVSTLGSLLAESNQNKAAAKDMEKTRNFVIDVAAGKTLQHSGDNKHAELFDSPDPEVHPRIRKCLEATLEWCMDQEDELKERIESLSVPATKKPVEEVKEEAEEVSRRFQYVDETAGMLFEISQLADIAMKEINLARGTFAKSSHSAGRGPGPA